MAKFRRLRITALPMHCAGAALFPKKRSVLPLKDVQGKSSHSSLTYLPAVYAIAALGRRGRAPQAGLVSLDWGTTWAKSRAQLIAQVPSIVVPEECNFPLDPAHPLAATLVAKKIRRWTYDDRL